MLQMKSVPCSDGRAIPGVRGPKIFGTGLSKTGTTSLTEALRILGYDSYHWPLSMEELVSHEAVTDITVACRFRYLDRRFPGSRFIHTVRDRHTWLESCRSHWSHLDKQRGTPALPAFALEAETILFAGLEFDATRWLAAYDRHEAAILNHFADRRQALLVMDITRGDGWRRLCGFLRKPVPSVEFPRANSRFSEVGQRPPAGSNL